MHSDFSGLVHIFKPIYRPYYIHLHCLTGYLTLCWTFVQWSLYTIQVCSSYWIFCSTLSKLVRPLNVLLSKSPKLIKGMNALSWFCYLENWNDTCMCWNYIYIYRLLEKQNWNMQLIASVNRIFWYMWCFCFACLYSMVMVALCYAIIARYGNITVHPIRILVQTAKISVCLCHSMGQADIGPSLSRWRADACELLRVNYDVFGLTFDFYFCPSKAKSKGLI
jgi:hypothetical protein